jgi:MoxR-like ATPase
VTHEQAIHILLPALAARIEREVLRLRGRYELSLDEFRGLYISDEQIDALLRARGFEPTPADALPPLTPAPGPWTRLVEAFALSPSEQWLVLLALAPELDPRYAPLYAYLNDDAARTWPTVDLALRLLAPSWQDREALRASLDPGAPLARLGLIRLLDDSVAQPQQAWRLSPVPRAFLLGLDPLAAAGLSVVEGAADDAPDIAAIANLLSSPEGRPIVVIEGAEGSGRVALAAAIARASGRRAVRLKPESGEAFAAAAGPAALAATLADAALVCVLDAIPPDRTAQALADARAPVMLAVGAEAGWRRLLADKPVVLLRRRTPPIDRRRDLWRDALRDEGVRAPSTTIDAAARRYRLNAGQIRRAARDVRLAALQPVGGRAIVPGDLVLESARAQCALNLDGLAQRISATAGWDDLVLPEGVRTQLQDFAAAARERDQVFEGWGFGGAGRGHGRGVAALFAGVSGTGKTMSAAVIARVTGLELWRIDLSAIVSKYIGETEKNLERIFAGAKAGDAILFFDEADALFGKRSEVKDAHDRYANIEVAYLLQRLEEHDGVAILASNFSRNIDAAFVRRLQFIVEFPMPGAGLRERLWRKAFPAGAPLAKDVDFRFLARQFAFAGGDIRSAALDAAFLAAQNGGVVTMAHLVRAVSRQLLKQGKLPARGDFGPYHDQLGPAAASGGSA